MRPDDVGVPGSELMPIGVFARRSGLTASALRFYADSGLLPPAEVDALTGYRFYDPAQLERAVLLRKLREIGMPLATVGTALDARPDDVAGLVDEQVAKVADDAAVVRQRAAAIKSSLAGQPGLVIATLAGPVLSTAIDQVLTATAYEPGMAVLNGVHVESTPDAVTVTATDRYRLATRTLVPADPADVAWAATVNADDLRNSLPDLRHSPRVTIEATTHGVRLRLSGRQDRHCGVLSEAFPDYRLMLAALPEVTTRVTVPKAPLLGALEQHAAARVSLHAADTVLTVAAGSELPATVTGPPVEIRFEMTTLYPAVSSAIGSDVLIDLRGPEAPATIRSADLGDLTSLAMPSTRDS